MRFCLSDTNMTRTKVLIGIPLLQSVAAEFFKSFLGAINIAPEQAEMMIMHTKWGNTVNARNEIVEECLKDDFTHLFFMDSDMAFPEFTLQRLLLHDVDIVAGYYLKKIPMFDPVVLLQNNNGSLYKTYLPEETDTLVEVATIGTGCCLIKRKILESFKWPWFEYIPYPDGKHRFQTEDVVFCDKAREKGFKIYCDPTVSCVHIGTSHVEPEFVSGKIQAKIMAT